MSSETRKLTVEEMHRISVEEFRQADKMPVVVVLDNVRSLHNIGSVFRTCDAFRISVIYLCGISATPPHPEIHKSALGAEFSVAWRHVADTMEAVTELRNQGFRIYAVEQTENSCLLQEACFDADESYALVFGNEIRGVSQDVVDACDGTLEIPQFGTKHSFNVSVCAGIVLWEVYKQRNAQ